MKNKKHRWSGIITVLGVLALTAILIASFRMVGYINTPEGMMALVCFGMGALGIHILKNHSNSIALIMGLIAIVSVLIALAIILGILSL